MTQPAVRPERCSICDRLTTGPVRCRCPSSDASGTCLVCGFTVRRSSPGLEAALEVSALVVAHRKTAHPRLKSPVFSRPRFPGSPGIEGNGDARHLPRPLAPPEAA
jgi:hypothetical protein